MHFAGGLTLRTHLRMTGSWHVYRERERWRKPAYLARAVVGTDSGWVAVCFSAPVVETYHRAVAEPDALAALGPDLCLAGVARADACSTTIVARAARLGDPAATLGEALLDQRIAAGIGNVYKSEACFACGLAPTAPSARCRRRGPPPRVGDGRPAAPGQPRTGPSGAPTRPGWPSTARRGHALPPLRHPHPHGPPRRPGPQHLLVPALPGRGPPIFVKSSRAAVPGVAVVPKVVVVGAGFGGIEVARHLAGRPVDITLVDRNNFHTFQPLLYQVATAGLNAADVAHVVRGLFHGQRNLRFRQATVTGVDWDARTVLLDGQPAAAVRPPRGGRRRHRAPTSAPRARPSTASRSTRWPMP